MTPSCCVKEKGEGKQCFRQRRYLESCVMDTSSASCSCPCKGVQGKQQQESGFWVVNRQSFTQLWHMKSLAPSQVMTLETWLWQWLSGGELPRLQAKSRGHSVKELAASLSWSCEQCLSSFSQLHDVYSQKCYHCCWGVTGVCWDVVQPSAEAQWDLWLGDWKLPWQVWTKTQQCWCWEFLSVLRNTWESENQVHSVDKMSVLSAPLSLWKLWCRRWNRSSLAASACKQLLC